mgnify:CR=1 FL=1
MQTGAAEIAAELVSICLTVAARRCVRSASATGGVWLAGGSAALRFCLDRDRSVGGEEQAEGGNEHDGEGDGFKHGKVSGAVAWRAPEYRRQALI